MNAQKAATRTLVQALVGGRGRPEITVAGALHFTACCGEWTWTWGTRSWRLDLDKPCVLFDISVDRGS